MIGILLRQGREQMTLRENDKVAKVRYVTDQPTNQPTNRMYAGRAVTAAAVRRLGFGQSRPKQAGGGPSVRSGR